MSWRPHGRLEYRGGTVSERLELPDFEWTTPGSPEPSEPPREPRKPYGRRRLIAVLVLLLFVGAIGAGLALLIGGDSLTSRDRSQLEAAAPGSSKAGHAASLKVPRVVKRSAAALPLPRAVAQLFAVTSNAQYSNDPFFNRLKRHDFGVVVLGQQNVVDPVQAKALTDEMTATAKGARHLAPLIAADQAGGPASAFPDMPPKAQPLAGDSNRPAQVRSDALAAAKALRGEGVRMTLAPVADVGVAADPVQDQVFSDDARVVTRLTGAAVDGYRRGRV